VCIACWIPRCVELKANHFSSHSILTSTVNLNQHLFKQHLIELKGNQKKT
jgi:hypothetical protein